MHKTENRNHKNEILRYLVECQALDKAVVQHIELEISDPNFICSNEEWKIMVIKLLNLFKPKTEPKVPKLKLESFEIVDIWENNFFKEPVCNDTVPFEIGMKLLKDDISFEDIPNMNLPTKVTKAIAEIEEAAKIDFNASINKHTEERVKVLEDRKNYWKTLAQKRLIELRKEFEFRNQIVFNHLKNQ